jgi:hypothetical protein
VTVGEGVVVNTVKGLVSEVPAMVVVIVDEDDVDDIKDWSVSAVEQGMGVGESEPFTGRLCKMPLDKRPVRFSQ